MFGAVVKVVLRMKRETWEAEGGGDDDGGDDERRFDSGRSV